jgi:hypothetical protein
VYVVVSLIMKLLRNFYVLLKFKVQVMSNFELDHLKRHTRHPLLCEFSFVYVVVSLIMKLLRNFLCYFKI